MNNILAKTITVTNEIVNKTRFFNRPHILPYTDYAPYVAGPSVGVLSELPYPVDLWADGITQLTSGKVVAQYSLSGNTGTGGYLIKTDGTLWSFWNSGVSTTPVNNAKWSYVCCDYYGVNSSNTYAIKTDGTLWFNNFSTQCGTASNWKKIVSCYACLYGLQSDGTIWILNGVSGHTRFGTAMYADIFKAAYSIIAKHTDGTLVNISPYVPYEELALFPNGSYIVNGIDKSFAAPPISEWVLAAEAVGNGQYGDNYASYVLNKAGEAYCVNRTGWVRLTFGVSPTLFKNISTSYNVSYGITADGTIWSWGWSSSGIMYPTQLDTNTNWIFSLAYYDGRCVFAK